MTSRIRFTRVFTLLGAILILLALVSGATADSLAVNFEAYSLGTVHGQDGWSSSGAAGGGQHPNLQNHAGQGQHPNLQNRGGGQHPQAANRSGGGLSGVDRGQQVNREAARGRAQQAKASGHTGGGARAAAGAHGGGGGRGGRR